MIVFIDLEMSDIDMEKPWFPNVTAAYAKEPLVLSQSSADKLIQVLVMYSICNVF